MEPGEALSQGYIEAMMTKESQDIFLDASAYAISNPRHGDIYLFRTDKAKINYKKTILKDTCLWYSRGEDNDPRCHYSTQKYYIKRTNPETNTMQYTADFKRFVYSNNHMKRVVVHYSGKNDVVDTKDVLTYMDKRIINDMPNPVAQLKDTTSNEVNHIIFLIVFTALYMHSLITSMSVFNISM